MGYVFLATVIWRFSNFKKYGGLIMGSVEERNKVLPRIKVKSCSDFIVEVEHEGVMVCAIKLNIDSLEYFPSSGLSKVRINSEIIPEEKKVSENEPLMPFNP